jgi:hypothetical protein
MVRLNEIWQNEVSVDLPPANDAGLIFIGRIRTPWTDRLHCPRQGRADGPICRIEIDPLWQRALDGIEQFERIGQPFDLAELPARFRLRCAATP